MNKSKKYIPPIVIPAYNRPESLQKLLDSLNSAHYPTESIDLYISLDYGATPEVEIVANSFEFSHGNKNIIKRDHKQGVKNHILACAELSEDYGSVLILEDDLIVSPDYYLYASEALQFYSSENSVAGISLYSQRFNETAHLPFEPLPCEYAVYFMQLACSWGQAWTAEQFKMFKEWSIESKSEESAIENGLPNNVKEWGNDSWKKVFNMYLLITNKTIVYPYRSFTTNNSEAGGRHMKNKGNLFQVPLSLFIGEDVTFHFPEFSKQKIRYDMFMESNPEIWAPYLGLKRDEICVDLYGTKPLELLNRYSYTITSRTGPKPLRSIPMNLRPHELNMKMSASGGDAEQFHVYKKEQVVTLKPLTAKQYTELAIKFCYFKPVSRRFLWGYLQRIVFEIFKKK